MDDDNEIDVEATSGEEQSPWENFEEDVSDAIDVLEEDDLVMFCLTAVHAADDGPASSTVNAIDLPAMDELSFSESHGVWLEVNENLEKMKLPTEMPNPDGGVGGMVISPDDISGLSDELPF